MSARTGKRRQAGLSRERLIALLAVIVITVAVAAIGLYANGSLTLDNLLVELGLKPPAAVVMDDIPDYSGQPYVVLEDNWPDFDAGELTLEAFETYSELDALGRCGPAYANICLEIMPTEPRGDIGQVKPSGWQTAKYDCVDGKYLYNRCHLIGYQLAGENANRKNLITGTRYMNVEGMLPFENMVDDYVENTGNHVLYRVTPVFEGANLVASGVQLEAFSVEDEGEGVCFNVYVYNVQPGVGIDYATGESWEMK
ncbi:MAG: DNA/RNA non-specific endonuclease [Oscillospiraceae bacterium]|jgi:DNA-entry nuclease|nr:DNA/RNA non-specific endonuclease [Oscillospiraceae bacterium]